MNSQKETENVHYNICYKLAQLRYCTEKETKKEKVKVKQIPSVLTFSSLSRQRGEARFALLQVFVISIIGIVARRLTGC